jgi:DUF4097 and DUF4098 domain-containing protein YvlB
VEAGGDGTTVRVTTRSGSVTVIGEERSDVVVDPATEPVTAIDQSVEVVGRSDAITVRCPTGSSVIVGSASGSIALQGRLGAVQANTGSGSIAVERATRADVRTRSGGIDVSRCDGECRGQSGSGSLRIGSAESVDLVAKSGDVDVGAVGSARVHAVSGAVRLGITTPGEVEVDVLSGSVAITLPPGQHPATDLLAKLGKVRCDCPPGDDGELRVTARSGSITVTER